MLQNLYYRPYKRPIMALARTPEALAEIERALIQSYGDMHLAARSLQISVYDLTQWVTADPEVSQRVHHAQLLGWQSLESEAIRRATGYTKPVWYQGVEVGEEVVYSDGLLSQLLKARVPGHQADQAQTRPMVQVNIIPRANTYEEWLEQRTISLDDGALKEAQRQHQLSGDKAVVEAEYSEVTPEVTSGLPDWL